MLVSLIIPAYNEGKRIRSTLEQYLAGLLPGNQEILVVLNGCTDNTRQIVEQARQDLGQEIILHDLKTGGKGLAVQYGFKRARGDLIGFADADGATSPAEYKKLIQAIVDDKYDGAIASRWLAGSQIVGRESVMRKIASQTFFIITRLLFWLPFRDTQCGAKIFRRAVIEKIVPQLKIKNMAFDVELLFLAHQAGFRIKEVPSVWVDKSSSEMLGSTTKLIKTSLAMFSSLIKVRLKHLFK